MRTVGLNKLMRARALEKAENSAAGFTMIEMVIAMMLMLVGLLALASAIGIGLTVSNSGRNITNSKLLVVSLLEQIETLRNTDELMFSQIANRGDVDNTGASRIFDGFPLDFQPVSTNPGPDGIFGTDDDLIDAGPDGTYGTGDDFTNQNLVRQGFERKIIVESLSENFKKITVTLHYPGGNGMQQTIEGVSYLNNDAHSNFRR